MYNLFNRVFTFKKKAKSKTILKNVIPSTNISADNINDPISVDEPMEISMIDNTNDQSEYLYEYGFFIDNSKSTEKNKEYHALLSKIIKQPEYSNAKYYYFNSICYETDYNTVLTNSTKSMYGIGGTNIEGIYKFIKANKISFQNLVIFTDAVISENIVQNILFDAKNINYKKYWNNVIGYMLNPKYDISVFSPFIYGCTYKLYNIYNKIVDEYNHSNNDILTIIRQLNTEKHIESYIDIIEKRILANTSVSSDQIIKLELILANTRITSNIYTNLDFEITRDPLVIIKAARTFYQTNINSINNKLNYLIEKCDIIRGFDLPKVPIMRIIKDNHVISYTAYESVVDKIDYMITNKPIVLFIKSNLSIIEKTDSAYNDIANNPLKILSYPRILQNFKKQYIQVLQNSSDIDITDYNVFSFDLESSTKMNMQFISEIFYNDNKFPGAYGIWIMAIYYTLFDIIPMHFHNHMNTNMKLFLINTPTEFKIPMGIYYNYPDYKTSIDIALYYCVLSTFIYSKKYVDRDLMKQLAWLFKPILFILKLSDIDVGEYVQRIDILKTAANIIKSYNVNNLSCDRVLRTILSKVAKTLVYNNDIYILDKIISEADYQTCLEYTVHKYIKHGMNFKDFMIDFNIKLINPIIDLNIGNTYSEYENSKQSKSVPMSCRSLRPISVINNKSWIDYSENAWGPLYKQISMYRYMLDYYIIYKTFPNPNSLSDMIKYIELLGRTRIILPNNIDISYKDIAQKFQDSFNRRKILFPDLCSYDKVFADIKAGISIHKRQVLESRDNLS